MKNEKVTSSTGKKNVTINLQLSFTGLNLARNVQGILVIVR